VTGRPELDRVWQPLTVGPMTLKNRVIVPARVLNWSRTGVLSDRHLAHYQELADGGAAMIVTEQHAAYPVALGSFHNPCSAWEHAAVPRFRQFASIVHERQAHGVVELFGTGVHDKGTMMMDDWKPLWGVSDIPSVVHFEVPAVMTGKEIAQVGRPPQPARALPRQGGWATAAEDLIRAAGNAGVDLRTGTRADAAFVRAFGADQVYLAVGARYDDRGVSAWRPEADEVPGIRAANVMAVDEAVRRVLAGGGAALGGHVVIVDEAGTYLPLALAELLATAGTRTRVVTGQMFVGREAVRHLQLPWIMPRLIEAGVEVTAQRRLDAVRGSSVVLSDRWLDNSHVIDDVSAVVLSLFRRSRTALSGELADLGDRVARVGDALAPRKLAELIYEGELIGRAV
jgi:NADH:flavin oxidoreductase / NADH oxidase family